MKLIGNRGRARIRRHVLPGTLEIMGHAACVPMAPDPRWPPEGALWGCGIAQRKKRAFDPQRRAGQLEQLGLVTMTKFSSSLQLAALRLKSTKRSNRTRIWRPRLVKSTPRCEKQI